MSGAGRHVASVGAFVVIPLATICSFLILEFRSDNRAVDLVRAFLPAARAVSNGDSPYVSPSDPSVQAGVAYVYPPLTAALLTPFAAVPEWLVVALATAVLVALVPATLAVLGVRDPRCYGVAFLWAPVLSAIQTANVSLPLAFALALVWRWRSRWLAAGVVTGVGLALKPVLWPVAVWLALTGRIRASTTALGVAAAATVTAWAATGFPGIHGYVALTRASTRVQSDDAYTVYAVARAFGSSQTLAFVIALVLTVALVALLITTVRGREIERSLVVAVAVAFAASPLVWLHYAALLLAPVAIASRRLSAVWFVPTALWVTTGTGNGAPWQTIVGVGSIAATLALCFAASPVAGQSAVARTRMVTDGSL